MAPSQTRNIPLDILNPPPLIPMEGTDQDTEMQPLEKIHLIILAGSIFALIITAVGLAFCCVAYYPYRKCFGLCFGRCRERDDDDDDDEGGDNGNEMEGSSFAGRTGTDWMYGPFPMTNLPAGSLPPGSPPSGIEVDDNESLGTPPLLETPPPPYKSQPSPEPPSYGVEASQG